jgi:hypothetical protein
MNIHAPPRAKEEWPGFEFRGRRRRLEGFTWIKARHRTGHINYFYCFEKNVFTSYDRDLSPLYRT